MTKALLTFAEAVWVDAETLDLVRVDLKVNRIPLYGGVRSMRV
jgi:hypothetical protein